jgi:hypothetical protein
MPHFFGVLLLWSIKPRKIKTVKRQPKLLIILVSGVLRSRRQEAGCDTSMSFCFAKTHSSKTARRPFLSSARDCSGILLPPRAAKDTSGKPGFRRGAPEMRPKEEKNPSLRVYPDRRPIQGWKKHL